LLLGDARITQEAMQQAALKSLVARNGQRFPLRVGRMAQTDVTPLLPRTNVSELFENSYEIVA